jgi:DNA topoisomerase IA
MAGSKDHIDVSPTNIIKLALEALPTYDQQFFNYRMRCEEEDMLRQLAERRKKEEEEMSRQLAEQRKKVEEVYLSHFAVDHH